MTTVAEKRRAKSPAGENRRVKVEKGILKDLSKENQAHIYLINGR